MERQLSEILADKSIMDLNTSKTASKHDKKLVKDLDNLFKVIQTTVKQSIPNVKLITLNKKFVITAENPILDDFYQTNESFSSKEVD